MSLAQLTRGISEFDNAMQREIQAREGMQQEMMNIKSQLTATSNNNYRTDQTMGTMNGTQYPPGFNNMPSNYAAAPSPPVTQQLTPQAHQILVNQMMCIEQRFNASQENLFHLAEEVKKLSARLNNLEQYLRRNNLLFHGLVDLPSLPDKPTTEDYINFYKYVVNKLNSLFPNLSNPITVKDIDDTHELVTKGRKRGKKVLIVRFVSRLVRNEIYSNKKTLKETPIAVTEHLTAPNLALLKSAQQAVGLKKAWTRYGKVMIDLNGSVRSIRNIDDLAYFCNNRKRMTPEAAVPNTNLTLTPDQFPAFPGQGDNQSHSNNRVNSHELDPAKASTPVKSQSKAG